MFSAGMRGLAFLSVAVLCQAQKDLGGGWQEKKKDDGKVVQELKIEAPTMTEEDQYGYNMPDRYKCDSCRSVMFHIEQELRKRNPKNRRMKSWEYTDAFDEICKTSFEGYGIKLINGENALSGPALRERDENLAPGSGAIQMGGESWTKRLGEICRKTVYEKVGEDEVYEAFYKQHKAADEAEAGAQLSLYQAFCVKELKECETGPKLPPKPKEPEEKPAKAEKAKPAKAAKAKKEKENAALKKTAKASADASEPARTSTAAEKVSVEAFLKGLASRHGVKSDEYLAPRSVAEWERLTLGISGKLYDRLATEVLPSGQAVKTK